VLGGDYALFGGWPAETVARLRELEPALWIRGNGERWSADPAAAPDQPVVQDAIAAVRAALGGDLVHELAALPAEATEGETLICHGSPVSDVRSFLPEPADDEPELLTGVTQRRLVFGHTHLPFRRLAAGVELVNPGSVGMPFDGDHRAAYALVRPDGSVEHRRVAYDHGASARRVRDAFGRRRWTDTVAMRLERATMNVD
jgi:diadenosine tetraphosphatase ApaH/serine/threonine PP2A family protein phosphatase